MTIRYAHQSFPDHIAFPVVPFIGRQREIISTWKQFEAIRNGGMRIVLLTGDIGIGKTRLLHEIAARARQDGAIVLQGEATDAEGMPPYLPFLEALGQYIQDTPIDLFREQTVAVLQPLVNILPEITDRLGHLPEPRTFPPEQTRLRIYEAVGTLLEKISASQMLVLTLDDLHWADPASLDLLCHIARHHTKARLLIVGAYWEREIECSTAFEQAVTRLAYRRVLTTITIDPLSSEEIEALAFSYLGGPLAASVSSLLYKQSEGNPFFAEEIIRSWLEAHHLVQKDRQWLASAPLEHTLPQSIIGSLRQRFMHLSREVINDLRIAAIIGHTFDLSLLATVEGQEFEVVEERLLQAKRARLIQSDHKGVFTFNHNKIREVLYAEVSISRHTRLHETIGLVLEKRYGHQGTRNAFYLADLAFHFTHSNDRVKGVNYAQLAAESAMQSSALEDASTYYHIALELLDPDDGRRGTLLLGLANAIQQQGKQDGEAETAYKSAIEWFAHSKDAEAAARAAHELALTQWKKMKLQAARNSFEYALNLIGATLNSEAINIHRDFAILLTLFLGRPGEGLVQAQQALQMTRLSGERELESETIRAIISPLSPPGNELMATLQTLEQTLMLAKANDGLSGMTELYLSWGYYWIAEIRHARDSCMQIIDLFACSRASYQLSYAYFLLTLSLLSQGQWNEAEQTIEQLRLIANEDTGLIIKASLHQVCGFLAYLKEDYISAEREFQWVAINQQHSPLGLILYSGLAGLAQAALGKQEQASDFLVQLDALLAGLPSGTPLAVPILLCQALIALKIGNQKRIAHLYSKLLHFSGLHYWFLVDRVLGMIAVRQGKWEVASIHLTAAEATARHESLQPELSQVLLEMADLELARAGQESTKRAQNYLKQALEIFEKLNCLEAAARTRVRQTELKQEATSMLTVSLPANLTQREVEVLRLVVKGKSNRQIAHDLKLSVRTVANHLSHIFNKTSSENRVEATTFAISHNLI